MFKSGERAIWHTKDVDLPVLIVRYAGKYQGEDYYFITDPDNPGVYETGVLASELSQEAPESSKHRDVFSSFFDWLLNGS